MKFTRTIRTRGFKPSWSAWIVSAAAIIFGLALLIRPAQTTGFILNFIGGVLMFIGAFRIARYFLKSRDTAMYNMDLGLGSTLAVIGLLIYVFKGFLLSIVPTIIGVILLVSGLIKLQTAIDFKRMYVHRWQLQMATSIISILMGAVILFNPFGTAFASILLAGLATGCSAMQRSCNIPVEVGNMIEGIITLLMSVRLIHIAYKNSKLRKAAKKEGEQA